MFVIFKPDTSLDAHIATLRESGVYFSTFENARFPILVFDGETPETIQADPNVIEILDETPRYPLVGRTYDPAPAIVRIGSTEFGPQKFAVIAGPCSVTEDEGLIDTALSVRNSGAASLRGGAFKPRTSPYAFQGVGEDGFHVLDEISRTGLSIVSEVMSVHQIDVLAPHVDAFQVGARNMQNFELLKALAIYDKPVVLKQGFGCTLDEFLHSAEYLVSGGNENVVLVTRGIRTYEGSMRFTLDIGAVAWLKRETRLPVVVDPSHAIGDPELIIECAKAAVAVGADGLMLEVHHNPESSPSDGDQALTLSQFESLMPTIEAIANLSGRELERIPTLQPIENPNQKKSS